MVKRTREGPSKAKFVEETLGLIAERGGAKEVNLREISRRVGCAHTNVYNYFSNLEALLWSAFDAALDLYAEKMVAGLNRARTPRHYFHKLIGNMLEFAQKRPGLYRFISSDPIDPKTLPSGIVEKVIAMKAYFMEVIFVLGEGKMTRSRAADVGNILLAYLDGETLNYINGRVLPEEDLLGRVLGNLETIFSALSRGTVHGHQLSRKPIESSALKFPTLEVCP